MVVSFKMDPRIASGNYGGERWVSPPTYVRLGEGKTCTIEARTPGAGTTWIPSDPAMVTIAPGHSQQITMTVLRAGESRVRVASDAGVTELTIKAAYRNDTLQVEISQS